MYKYLFVMCLFCNASLCAQHKKTVMLKAGNHVMDILSPTDVYYFTKFTEGKVYFKDGSKSAGRLNFNTLVNEIQFTDGGGDTVALADEKNISFVAINNDVFYYDNGYLRLLSGNNQAKLTVSDVWRIGEKRKNNVYNTSAPASSSNSFASYFVYNQHHNLMVNQDVELFKHERYFFGDKSNRILPANKKNLITLFPNHKSRIETFLAEHKTDFNNAEDLSKIIALLGQP